MSSIGEDIKAKEYWGNTEAQGKEYGPRPPLYAESLAHVIQRLAARTVLEMGCNSGRNLELLRRRMPRDTSLKGFDINSRSIEFGRSKWALDLDVADEDYLARLAPRSVDLVFTVSVLDHLPEIRGVLSELSRITRHYYVAVEPHPEQDLDYLDVFKADGRLRNAIDTKTPYSYLHPYYRLIPEVGMTAVLDVPMPPYAVSFGPLYRLTVWAQPGAGAGVSWGRLRDELMFAAVTRSFRAG